MKKLSKNFYEQRKTVEAMLGMCGNGKCVCDYPDTCNCELFNQKNYDAYMGLYKSTKNAFDTNVKQ